MPDIAERAPLRMVRMTRIACLFGVVEILEIPSALEIDEAVDARRHLASLLVADMKRAPIGAPDRSRQFEIGRASGRERGGTYVSISVVGVSLKKKKA